MSANLRLRVVPRFPVKVTASAPLNVVSTAGAITLTQDFTPLSYAPENELSEFTVLVQRDDGSFAKAKVDDISRNEYLGIWDATTNTPTITNGVGTRGAYYVVSVAGSTIINGQGSWIVGDRIQFNGLVWEKIPNSDAVTSVNGQTGTVVLAKADVGLGSVDNTSDADKAAGGPIADAINTRVKIDGTTPFTDDQEFAAGKTIVLGRQGVGNEAARADQLTALGGVGGLPNGTDLNTLVLTQRGFVTDAVNAPEAGAGKRWFVSVNLDPLDADGVIQTAVLSDGGTSVVTYTRRRTLAGAWQAWTSGAFLPASSMAEDGKALFWSHADQKIKTFWASPLDYTIDLRDLMDEVYGVGGWTQRTGIGVGSDAGAALILGVTRLRSRYGRGTVRIPPGQWRFITMPTPAELSGMKIEGQHSLSSQMVWGATGNFLSASGAGGWTGGEWRKLGIYRESGFSSSATAMQLQGDATHQPDQFTIEDIYCSSIGGAGFWTNGLNVTGIARTSPQGIRVASINNVQLFNNGAGGGFAAGFYNVVQGDIRNLGTYVGTGALGNNVYVGGGGAANTNTTQLSIDRLACGGELNLTNQTRTYYNGFCGNLAMAATADFVWGWIDASSTAGAIGANSNLIIR